MEKHVLWRRAVDRRGVVSSFRAASCLTWTLKATCEPTQPYTTVGSLAASRLVLPRVLPSFPVIAVLSSPRGIHHWISQGRCKNNPSQKTIQITVNECNSLKCYYTGIDT